MLSAPKALGIGLGLASLLASPAALGKEALSLAPGTQVYVVPSFAVNYTLFSRDAAPDATSFHSGFHMWSGICTLVMKRVVASFMKLTFENRQMKVGHASSVIARV